MARILAAFAIGGSQAAANTFCPGHVWIACLNASEYLLNKNIQGFRATSKFTVASHRIGANPMAANQLKRPFSLVGDDGLEPPTLSV